MVRVFISVVAGFEKSFPPCSLGDPCGVAFGVASVCVMIGGGMQHCFVLSSLEPVARPNNFSETKLLICQVLVSYKTRLL